MDEIDTSEEKATAFKGFSLVVALNPQSMEKDLLRFFTSIARYRDLKLQNPIKRELHEALQNVSYLFFLYLSQLTVSNPSILQVLNIYRQLIPQFNDFIGQLQPQDQQALKATYAL
jgi:hypothetical protein